MSESIVGLLDKADRAIAMVTELVEPPRIEKVAEAAAMLRRRLDHPDDILVVGVAGGTGSGKSSLVNAIAAAEVVQAGGVRPTTDRATAVASAASLSRLRGYLDALGIEAEVAEGVPSWLCLVDMPDTDSVELGHRLSVDHLLPHVDVVVWVVDPEKYQDSSLHHGYLEPLAEHGWRFVFAFNQSDRLDEESRAMAFSDFGDALVRDGIGSPHVFLIAAAPRSGPPVGIDALIEELGARRGSGVLARSLADLEEAAADLLEGLGPGSLDFEERMAGPVAAAAAALEGDDVAIATDHLTAVLEGLALRAGGPTGERIRGLSAAVPPILQQISEDLQDTALQQADRDTAEQQLVERVVAPVRALIAARAEAIASITDLSLSVLSIRAKSGV